MLLNIRSAGDLRAALYALAPALTVVLVSYGVLDDTTAALWGALVTGLAGPLLAAYKAKDVSALRAALYAVLGAAQGLLIAYGIATDEQIGSWLPVVSLLLGGSAGAVSAANTNTTPTVTDSDGYVPRHLAVVEGSDDMTEDAIVENDVVDDELTDDEIDEDVESLLAEDVDEDSLDIEEEAQGGADDDAVTDEEGPVDGEEVKE